MRSCDLRSFEERVIIIGNLLNFDRIPVAYLAEEVEELLLLVRDTYNLVMALGTVHAHLTPIEFLSIESIHGSVTHRTEQLVNLVNSTEPTLGFLTLGADIHFFKDVLSPTLTPNVHVGRVLIC